MSLRTRHIGPRSYTWNEFSTHVWSRDIDGATYTFTVTGGSVVVTRDGGGPEGAVMVHEFSDEPVLSAADFSMECDGMFLIWSTSAHLGLTPDRDEVVHHVAECEECWDRHSDL